MIRAFLKEWFELWCKNRWLKIIDKEVNKMNKYCDLWKRKKFVVDKLVDKFNELYPDLQFKKTIHK